jgi:catechol 2,3-dioxygenase-like lactoylglutathione lyase family enzyme
VKDLDRAETFYTEIMGMERLRRNRHMVLIIDLIRGPVAEGEA